MIRIVLFTALMFASFVLHPALLAAAAVVYTLRFDAYELIALGALIDAAYGVGTAVPYYTLGATLIVGAVLAARPHIRIFQL